MLLATTEIQNALRRREVLLFSSYYFIMGRKAKRCPKKCAKHSFLLKPVHYSANFSRELQASFCPASLTELSITPTFNKDKRYFTSCFYLPVDSEKLQNNQEYYRSEHEKYKIENADQKSNMLVPKPRSKNNYCNVCKTQYDDYLDHIKSGNHKSKIRENRFNHYIEEMCTTIQHKIKEVEEKIEDNKFITYADTFLSFSSQEQNLFEEKSPQKSYVPSFSVFQYRQINELLLSSRNFHPLQEQKSLGLFQFQNEIGFILPPISPIKKYSEATECLRGGTSSKLDRPIIIFGGNMGKTQ